MFYCYLIPAICLLLTAHSSSFASRDTLAPRSLIRQVYQYKNSDSDDYSKTIQAEIISLAYQLNEEQKTKLRDEEIKDFIKKSQLTNDLKSEIIAFLSNGQEDLQKRYHDYFSYLMKNYDAFRGSKNLFINSIKDFHDKFEYNLPEIDRETLYKIIRNIHLAEYFADLRSDGLSIGEITNIATKYNFGDKLLFIKPLTEDASFSGSDIIYVRTDLGEFILKSFPVEMKEVIESRTYVVNSIWRKKFLDKDGKAIPAEILGCENKPNNNKIWLVKEYQQGNRKLARRDAFSKEQLFQIGEDIGRFLNSDITTLNEEVRNIEKVLEYDLLQEFKEMLVFLESISFEGTSEDFLLKNMKGFLIENINSVHNKLVSLGFPFFSKGFFHDDLNRRNIELLENNGRVLMSGMYDYAIKYGPLVLCFANLINNYVPQDPDGYRDFSNDLYFNERTFSLLKGVFSKKKFTKEEALSLPLLFQAELLKYRFADFKKLLREKDTDKSVEGLFNKAIKYFASEKQIDYLTKYKSLVDDSPLLHQKVNNYTDSYYSSVELQNIVNTHFQKHFTVLKDIASRIKDPGNKEEALLEEGLRVVVEYDNNNEFDKVQFGWPFMSSEQVLSKRYLDMFPKVKLTFIIFHNKFGPMQTDQISEVLRKISGKEVIMDEIPMQKMQIRVNQLLRKKLKENPSAIIYNPFHFLGDSILDIGPMMTILQNNFPSIDLSLFGRNVSIWGKAAREGKITLYKSLAEVYQRDSGNDVAVVPCMMDNQWEEAKLIIAALLKSHKLILIPGKNMVINNIQKNKIRILKVQEKKDILLSHSNITSYVSDSMEPFFINKGSTYKNMANLPRNNRFGRQIYIKDLVKDVTGKDISQNNFSLFCHLFSSNKEKKDMSVEYWSDLIISHINAHLNKKSEEFLLVSLSYPLPGNKYQIDFEKELFNLLTKKIDEYGLLKDKGATFTAGKNFLLLRVPQGSIDHAIDIIGNHEVVYSVDTSFPHIVAAQRGTVVTFWPEERFNDNDLLSRIHEGPLGFSSVFNGSVPVTIAKSSQIQGYLSYKNEIENIVWWGEVFRKIANKNTDFVVYFKNKKIPWREAYKAVVAIKELERLVVEKDSREVFFIEQIKESSRKLKNSIMTFSSLLTKESRDVIFQYFNFNQGLKELAEIENLSTDNISLKNVVQTYESLMVVVDSFRVSPLYKMILFCYQGFSKANPLDDNIYVFRDWLSSSVRKSLYNNLGGELCEALDSFLYKELGARIAEITEINFKLTSSGVENLDLFLGDNEKVELNYTINEKFWLNIFNYELERFHNGSKESYLMDALFNLSDEVDFKSKNRNITSDSSYSFFKKIKMLNQNIRELKFHQITESFLFTALIALDPDSSRDDIKKLIFYSGVHHEIIKSLLINHPAFDAEMALVYMGKGIFLNSGFSDVFQMKLKKKITGNKKFAEEMIKSWEGQGNHSIIVLKRPNRYPEQMSSSINRAIISKLRNDYFIVEGAYKDSGSIRYIATDKMHLIGNIILALDEGKKGHHLYEMFDAEYHPLNENFLKEYLSGKFESAFIAEKLANAFLTKDINMMLKDIEDIIKFLENSEFKSKNISRLEKILRAAAYSTEMNFGEVSQVILFRKNSREHILNKMGFSKKEELCQLFYKVDVLKEILNNEYPDKKPEDLDKSDLLALINSLNEYLFTSVAIVGAQNDWSYHENSIRGDILELTSTYPLNDVIMKHAQQFGMTDPGKYPGEFFLPSDKFIPMVNRGPHRVMSEEELYREIADLNVADSKRFEISLSLLKNNVKRFEDKVLGKEFQIDYRGGAFEVKIGDYYKKTEFNDAKVNSINDLLAPVFNSILQVDFLISQVKIPKIKYVKDGCVVDYDLVVKDKDNLSISIKGAVKIRIHVSERYENLLNEMTKLKIRKRNQKVVKTPPVAISELSDKVADLSGIDRVSVREVFNIIKDKLPDIYEKALVDEGHGFMHSFKVLQLIEELSEVYYNETGFRLSSEKRKVFFLSSIFHDLLTLDYGDTRLHAIDGAKEAYKIVSEHYHLFDIDNEQLDDFIRDTIVTILRHDGLKNNVLMADEFKNYHSDIHFREVALKALSEKGDDIKGDILSQIFYFADKLTAMDMVRIANMPNGYPRFDMTLSINTDKSIEQLATDSNSQKERLAPIHREVKYHYHNGLDQLNIIFYNLFIKSNPDNFEDPIIKKFLYQNYPLNKLLQISIDELSKLINSKVELLLALRTMDSMLAYYINELKERNNSIVIWQKMSSGFIEQEASVSLRRFANLKKAKKFLSDWLDNFERRNNIYEKHMRFENMKKRSEDKPVFMVKISYTQLEVHMFQAIEFLKNGEYSEAIELLENSAKIVQAYRGKKSVKLMYANMQNSMLLAYLYYKTGQKDKVVNLLSHGKDNKYRLKDYYLNYAAISLLLLNIDSRDLDSFSNFKSRFYPVNEKIKLSFMKILHAFESDENIIAFQKITDLIEKNRGLNVSLRELIAKSDFSKIDNHKKYTIAEKLLKIAA